MKFFQDYNKLEVSGPFGKGLGIRSEGIHIAFAAGTGVLTFMDLVAQIALHNLGFCPQFDCLPEYLSVKHTLK